MKKVVKLTESDLTRIVRRVLNEQESGNEKFQKDYDHFNLIVKPRMKSAGFKYIDEPEPQGLLQHYGVSPYGSGYFAYPNHNNGVNLFLNKFEGNWKYVVSVNTTNNKLEQEYDKLTKEFGWRVGTDAEVKSAANKAVDYAISLKNKLYPR